MGEEHQNAASNQIDLWKESLSKKGLKTGLLPEPTSLKTFSRIAALAQSPVAQTHLWIYCNLTVQHFKVSVLTVPFLEKGLSCLIEIQRTFNCRIGWPGDHGGGRADLPTAQVWFGKGVGVLLLEHWDTSLSLTGPAAGMQIFKYLHAPFSTLHFPNFPLCTIFKNKFL